MRKRIYFTEAEVKAGRKRSQDARRARRAAASLCLDCDTPVENRRVCEACCRRSTVRKHLTGRFKTYRLGSKLSPERSKYWLHLIKCSNPILAKNWTEVLPWLEKNFELYVEREDPILHNYSPLRMSGTDLEGKAETELASASVTLEDLVVAKIDQEKEAKEMRKLVEARIA